MYIPLLIIFKIVVAFFLEAAFLLAVSTDVLPDAPNMCKRLILKCK